MCPDSFSLLTGFDIFRLRMTRTELLHNTLTRLCVACYLPSVGSRRVALLSARCRLKRESLSLPDLKESSSSGVPGTYRS